MGVGYGARIVAVGRVPGALQRLWWRIAGAPPLWVWPRRIFFQLGCDPAEVALLKLRVDEIAAGKSQHRRFVDRYTGPVWICTVGPWEFAEIEIWEPDPGPPGAKVAETDAAR